MSLETRYDKLKKRNDWADVAKLAALEDELQALKAEAGIEEKRSRFFRFIDRKIENHKEKEVNKKVYLRLLLTCGWFTGAHRFYAGKKISGILYLLFCWTGIPFAMCLFDFMGILPKEADERGVVLL